MSNNALQVTDHTGHTGYISIIRPRFSNDNVWIGEIGKQTAIATGTYIHPTVVKSTSWMTDGGTYWRRVGDFFKITMVVEWQDTGLLGTRYFEFRFWENGSLRCYVSTQTAASSSPGAIATGSIQLRNGSLGTADCTFQHAHATSTVNLNYAQIYMMLLD